MQTIKIYKADFFIKKRFENSLKDIYSENKKNNRIIMKKFKTIIMLLLVAIALYAQRTPRVTNDFKEGDLIFQVSQSRQSPFI